MLGFRKKRYDTIYQNNLIYYMLENIIKFVFLFKFFRSLEYWYDISVSLNSELKCHVISSLVSLCRIHLGKVYQSRNEKEQQPLCMQSVIYWSHGGSLDPGLEKYLSSKLACFLKSCHVSFTYVKTVKYINENFIHICCYIKVNTYMNLF